MITNADIAGWTAAFLIAKTFRRYLVLWDDTTTTILSYLIGIPLLAWVCHVDLGVAAFLACLCRLALIAQIHILNVINHHLLEFLLLVLVFALHDEPAQMTAAIQVLVVSVWSFSVWQKVYHGEFVDGSFFYCTFARRAPRSPWLGKRFRDLPPVRAPYHEVFPATMAWCRRVAWITLCAETLLPFVALAFSGTPLAVAVMLALSIPVGLISRELDFMVTNIILAAFFLAPFDAAALSAAIHAHVAVAAIFVWAAVWPPIHAIVTRKFRISSWRLFGWGMYATVQCEIYDIALDGTLRPFRGPRPRVLCGFGECRIDAVRRFALRCCGGDLAGCANDAVGIGLRKLYRLSNTMASRYVVLAPGTVPAAFEVHDEPSRLAFTDYVSGLAARTREARAPAAEGDISRDSPRR